MDDNNRVPAVRTRRSMSVACRDRRIPVINNGIGGMRPSRQINTTDALARPFGWDAREVWRTRIKRPTSLKFS
jgi:hypothetical protein